MQKVNKKPGELTFKISAVLIGLSGLFEMLSLDTRVPFFGQLLSTPEVIIYHIIYIGLFIATGLGVWLARHWGYVVLQITCCIYVIDKLQVAFSPNTIQQYILSELHELAARYAQWNLDLSILEDSMIIDQFVFIMQVMAFTIAVCWLGFLIWARYRRGYFNQ